MQEINLLNLIIELNAELDALRPLSADQEQKIWQKFRFEWNYHSNNIEGNSLTFGETKSLLLHNITAQGKPLKDHLEITGHNEAIFELLDITRSNQPITESFVRNLHTLILKERHRVSAITPDGKPTTKWVEIGAYKTEPNHVKTSTGEVFRFAEPLEVAEKMRQLVELVNHNAVSDAGQAVAMAANVHYQFVLIHPFDDGNGRMARLLMNLVLIKNGLPPAIVKTEDKANYFAALRQADGGEIEHFRNYIAKLTADALQIMLAGARGENIDDDQHQDRKIAMLEKILEQKSAKLSVTKSSDSIRGVFANSFQPLAAEIVAAAKKFERFYLETSSQVFHNRGSPSGLTLQDGLAHIDGVLSDATTNLAICTYFSNLKYLGVDEVSYQWKVDFEFHPSSYSISISTGDKPAVRKIGYAEMLSLASRVEIVKDLVEHQIKFIESSTGTSISSP